MKFQVCPSCKVYHSVKVDKCESCGHKLVSYDLSGLFGKTEMEIVAVEIIKKCEKHKTWDVMFPVPKKQDLQVGFTWLLRSQYLNPVPSLSFMWKVNQDFVNMIKPACKTTLDLELSKDHPIRKMDGTDILDTIDPESV